MTAVELVFAIGWAAFWLYWLVAAFSMKRGRVPWTREGWIRVIVLSVAFVAARLGAFHGHLMHGGAVRAGVGLALWAVGVLFAVWARIRIGRYWGTPMTEKIEPELVTSGPYRLVRHPIYSGIILAGIGTSVALGWQIAVIFALAAIYFIYAATVEEKFLAEQFPEAYPRYKRTSKMLIPFVF